jgi:aspartyl-tRNA(Asn)/glutamyl-tRNA(Gln) amidotransferase subunit C
MTLFYQGSPGAAATTFQCYRPAAMRIGRDDVLHASALARLELDDDETERLIRDLGRILEYVEQLSELDTEGVAPTAHVSNVAVALREDRLVAGVEHDVALAEAPRTAAGGFAVPAFVDES